MSCINISRILKSCSEIIEKDIINGEFENPEYLRKYVFSIFKIAQELPYNSTEIFVTCYMIVYKFLGDHNSIYAIDVSKIIGAPVKNIIIIEQEILKLVKYDLISALKIQRMF